MMSDAPKRPVKPSHAPTRDRATAAVARALAELRRGTAVVLVDEQEGRAGVGIAAAECARNVTDLIEATGSVPACVIPASRAIALALTPTVTGNVAVACRGGGELMFDPEVARTIAGLNEDQAPPVGSTPLPADVLQDGGVELVKLARLLPAAIVSRIAGNAENWAKSNDVLTVGLADLQEYRKLMDGADAVLAAQAPVPLEGAEDATVYAFRPADGGKEHVAIVIGTPDQNEPVLTRLHSECLTGDLLGSLRCDCGDQLRGAIRAIAEAGGGVLIYLAQEGRGIGLVNKLRAYRLQDQGFDTIDANERLGFDADERVYHPAADILKALGFRTVRLLTNNPAKVEGLSAFGVEVVERVPHSFPANGHNEHYLRTKAARAGHLL